ncbi:hypothetical protein [Microbacterium aurum]
MAKPYQGEIARLLETLVWTQQVDISLLIDALRTSLMGPLVAVGSGGSLSTAHAMSQFHRLVSGHASTVLTPLESVTVRHRDTAVWLLSASGSNVDIVNAARALVAREPRQLAALVGREGSKLDGIAAAHPYIDLLSYPPPTGKDGFLATNTLFGSTALLARAYCEIAPAQLRGDGGLSRVAEAASVTSLIAEEWRTASAPLWHRDTTVVIHGSTGALGAIDLESKFTEAAVGHLQIADYRNFAHGRHHWLAKRGEQTGLIALIGDDDWDIAERTLRLLPKDVPVARISIPGSPMQATLMSLLAALRLTDWAGQARGIDPGDPGVPDFGRRIYHLAPSRTRATALPSGLNRRSAAAIERKSGRTVRELADSRDLKEWQQALRTFQRELSRAMIGGVVLDYDGTVVDTRHRFDQPRPAMLHELLRLLESGVPLGIATGRGQSVRRVFQEVIPRTLWPQVVIGYYNGAEVSTLADDYTPNQNQAPTADLREVANRLLADPELAAEAHQEHRRHQLTLSSRRAMGEERLWEVVQTVVRDVAPNAAVLRSSHSIDVLDPAASKLNVVNRLRTIGGTGAILAIGDRGRWPGNDYELLSLPLSLSVDQTSSSRMSGWNLGAPGQRGPAITLEYLRNLQFDDQTVLRMKGMAP